MTAARPVELSMFPDVAPDRPVGPIIGSVQTGTNADLMAVIAPMYLDGHSVLDTTYGEGKWWTRYRPERFTFHDLHKVDGVDFRALPEPDGSVDVVCFDPPYVNAGRALASTRGDFMRAYGLGGRSRTEFYDLIVDGLVECLRVARVRVLVKCMEFAQGGRFHDIPTLVTNVSLEHGAVLHDRIVHHTGTGPGGHNIFTPTRARRHHSYLLVFEVP